MHPQFLTRNMTESNHVKDTSHSKDIDVEEEEEEEFDDLAAYLGVTDSIEPSTAVCFVLLASSLSCFYTETFTTC